MAIRYYYMNPSAVAVELTSRIWTALTWHSSAEELNAVQCEWVIEDPASDLLLYPFRRVYVVDDAAPAGHTVIGMGSIIDVHIRRSEVYGRTATSRAWHLTITDLNYNATRFLLDGDDTASRPDETDLARLTWLLATNDVQASGMGDSTAFQDTTGGVALDGYNFITSSPYDVLRGMMDQSGRNAFVLYDESKGPPNFDVAALGELAIWYAHPSSNLWAASVALSNDPADINPATGTFALGEDDLDLHVDPTRIYSRLYGAYDGGLVDTGNDATIAGVYTTRETVVQMSDLKTSAKALVRANRMRAEGGSPATRIQWGYTCGVDYVNGLLAGQSFQYRATHLGGLTDLGIPDYSLFTGIQVRAMVRTVVEKAPGVYYVSGTAVPTGVFTSLCTGGTYPETASGTYAPLNSGTTNASAVFYYTRPGLPNPIVPTPGFVGDLVFPEYGTGGGPDYAGDSGGNLISVMVVGDGTLSITTATYGGVPHNLSASLVHGAVGSTPDETQNGVTGDTFTFAVSSHGGTQCVHRVDITERAPILSGGKFGFAGATWTQRTT